MYSTPFLSILKMMIASLCAVAVIAFGEPNRDFKRRKKAPNALLLRCKVLADIRKTDAARFAVRLLFPLNRLPPDTLFPGHKPNHDANCFPVFQRLISSPISEIIFNPL